MAASSDSVRDELNRMPVNWVAAKYVGGNTAREALAREAVRTALKAVVRSIFGGSLKIEVKLLQ